LVEFPPIGRLFSLGSFLITEVCSPILGLLFSQVYIFINFYKKRVGLHIGRLLKQTHPVTLLLSGTIVRLFYPSTLTYFLSCLLPAVEILNPD
jgi:hypothetical protein